MPAQAALTLAGLGPAVGEALAEGRLHDCVNVILSNQNGDGGWATYENTRSYSALEVPPSGTLAKVHHMLLQRAVFSEHSLPPCASSLSRRPLHSAAPSHIALCVGCLAWIMSCSCQVCVVCAPHLLRPHQPHAVHQDVWN